MATMIKYAPRSRVRPFVSVSSRGLRNVPSTQRSNFSTSPSSRIPTPQSRAPPPPPNNSKPNPNTHQNPGADIPKFSLRDLFHDASSTARYTVYAVLGVLGTLETYTYYQWGMRKLYGTPTNSETESDTTKMK